MKNKLIYVLTWIDTKESRLYVSCLDVWGLDNLLTLL